MWMVSIHVLFCQVKCRVIFWVLLLLYFPFKSEFGKSETQSQFNHEFSLLNLIDCALFGRPPGPFLNFWDPKEAFIVIKVASSTKFSKMLSAIISREFKNS